MRNILSLLLCAFLFIQTLSAQLLPADSSLLSSSIENSISLHNKVLGENIHLYNGFENPGYNHLAKGHPYFLADSLQYGTVLYDDTYYKDVPMLYDLVQDNVVIQQYSLDKTEASEEYKKMLRQDLVKDKIGWFTLPGREFVRLPADSSSAGMRSGFYERKYNGNVKLFVKRFKRYVEEVKDRDLERRYDLVTEYYILKDRRYYPVRSWKTLGTVFKDRKKEVNSFAQKNRKKYKRDKEQLFYLTTLYYDQLTAH